MFTVYNFLLFAHILLFVYWLGSDIGVFYGVRFVLNPNLSLEARRTVMALVHWIDAFPRICLVLMVPVGISLALHLELLAVPPAAHTPLLVAVWVIGLAWLAMVLRIYNGATGWLTSVDWVVRIAMMLAFVGAGVASLAGVGPVAPGANWLAAKLILFGAVIGCGIALRILGRPFGRAYAQIMAGQSTPKVELSLRTTMRQTRAVVVVLWVLVALTAFIGLTKSF
jgi:hypothetical protein